MSAIAAIGVHRVRPHLLPDRADRFPAPAVSGLLSTYAGWGEVIWPASGGTLAKLQLTNRAELAACALRCAADH